MKLLLNSILILLFVGVLTHVNAQQIDSSITESASPTITDFNRGKFTSPLQLIKGRVPGVRIDTDGDDPNAPVVYRLRGINSFYRNQPLFIVDGLPYENIDHVPVLSIKNIHVLKNVSQSLRYGLRGSSGVIEITTINNQKADNTLHAFYSGYISGSAISQRHNVLTAEEYIQAGGNDLGASTNWQDEVSRNAFSYSNVLGLSWKVNNTEYHISGNTTGIDGVLKYSEFKRLSGNASVKQSLFEDKLQLQLMGSVATINRGLSYSEAFRYAATYNPSSPIYFDSGDFYQPIIFDGFNPLSILELNRHTAENRIMNIGFTGDFAVTEYLNLSTSFNKQMISNREEEYNSYKSFFRGMTQNGDITNIDADRKISFFNSELSYDTQLGNSWLTLGVGMNFEELSYDYAWVDIELAQYRDIPFYLSGDRWIVEDFKTTTLSDNSSFGSETYKNSSIYGSASISFEKLELDGMLRSESYNFLGSTTKNQWFHSTNANYNIPVDGVSDVMNELQLSIGYGKNGQQPGLFGIADGYSRTSRITNTTMQEIGPNPDLTLPVVTEWTLGSGLSMLAQTLMINAEFYNRATNGLLTRVSIPFTESVSGSQYQNALDIRTRGLELTMDYQLIDQKKLNWNTQLIVNKYKITLEDAPIDEYMAGPPGAPGQGSSQMVRIAKGEELGQFWGPVFSGNVDGNGELIMEDLNGDGMVISNMGSALDDDADFRKLGSAIPDIEIGWVHSISYNNFKVETLFRGVFGHSKVYMHRFFYDLPSTYLASYNRTVTDYSRNDIYYSIFSSHYVERADFVKLENITVSYTLDSEIHSLVNALEFFISANNVFTITNYSGLDPEPVYQDYGPVDNGGYGTTLADPFVMGIDRRNSYLPARTIMAGINLKL